MRKVEYKIEKLEKLGGNIIHLRLSPKTEGQRIDYRPGQYGLVSFLKGKALSKERPFSFLSSPLSDGHLEFGFKVFGDFTTEFAELKEGDSVFVRGPYGSFLFNENKYKDTVFLSAGIGITPFISIFRYAATKKLPNKLLLLYSNKTVQDTPFYDEIKSLESINENFHASFFTTNKDEPITPGFIPGRINQEEVFKAINGDIKGKTFFICGPQLFYETMEDILKKLGVKAKDIKTEGFTLSPKSFFESGTWTFPLVAGASTLLMLASLYSVYELENAKALDMAALLATNAEKVAQMSVLNQEIIDNKNALLNEQKENTRTIYTSVPQSTSTQTPNVTPTSPSTPTTSTPPVTTTPPPATVPPKTTVS